jgi:hypothetical protein
VSHHLLSWLLALAAVVSAEIEKESHSLRAVSY